MNLWIQRHDFTFEEFGGATVESALERFESTDWETESRLASEKEEQGIETCPAGLGLVQPSGSVLHLCPDGSAAMMLHYHYPIARRVLGLIPKSEQSTFTLDSVPVAETEQFIRLHFSSGPDAFLDGAKRIEQGGGDQSATVPECVF